MPMEPSAQTSGRLSRRQLVRAVTGLGLSMAGGSLLAGCLNRVAPASPVLGGGSLETSRIRLAQFPSLCVAPQYVAEDLLRTEGFADIQYVKSEGGVGMYQAVAAGEIDISLGFVGPAIMQVDTGQPIVLLA